MTWHFSSKEAHGSPTRHRAVRQLKYQCGQRNQSIQGWLELLSKRIFDVKLHPFGRAPMSASIRWSQPVDATLYLREMECGDGSGISSRVYNGREDAVVGSLAARRVAQSDRAGVREAVIVDLFPGVAIRWKTPAERFSACVASIG